jgi:hypothetical protein
LRLQHRLPSNPRHRRIPLALRRPANLDLARREVHDPELGDAVPGIQRSFHIAIVGQTAAGDLDDQ